MVMEPQFQLTTKDHAILQNMLECYRSPRDPYLHLLERKVRDSAIYFRDDIPAGVVTLNSRFSYLIDGVRFGPHIAVASQVSCLPSFALSIHTLRGLALLGMAERNAIVIDVGGGHRETLQVADVVFQPEADARISETTRGVVQGDSAGRTRNVVSFRRGSAVALMAGDPSDDDDPGPRAA